jgi:predicted amidohydrolase YtcJ
MEPAAIELVGKHQPVPDVDTFKTLIPEAVSIYNREGITSIHDGAVGYFGEGPEVIRAYIELMKESQLNVRVYLTIAQKLYSQLLELGLFQGFGSEQLRLGALKMFQDGSIQGITAALSEDYHCRPGFKGDLIMPQAELDYLVEEYHQKGLQLAIHANGDKAIESTLQALEKANGRYPRDNLRHMIIHCQTASGDHIRRMKKLRVIPSYFVNHVYYWGDRHLSQFLGPYRAARINPLASSIKKGLRFTLHADTPVTPISPIFSIHNAVNRVTRDGQCLGPEECISPTEALKAYTVDAAYCSFEEDVKGSIEPGKLADFTILSENPLTLPKERIKEIEVLQTVVGGKQVYCKE